ncbi:unnamed protein product [Adineta steineri]|uniref:Uncharacterized protein n=1 Tax=Adineta steineri TaxID=433720 RepID=A0A814ZYW4_9BILA|nr:unnamed protein product [Adineta steineri]
MNTDNQQTKIDITNIITESNRTCKSPLIKSKVQMSRSHSPTLELLAAVQTKLDNYVTSVSNTISVPTVHEASSSPMHEEQQPTIHSRGSSSPSSLLQKQIRSKKNLSLQPLDKVTRTDNGNFKQKCSVEIWLPNACADNDEENTSRTVSRNSTSIEKIFQPIPVESPRSSINVLPSTAINNQIKPSDEISLKSSEITIIPHVQNNEDYLIDRPEKRPRSSKTNSTAKSNNSRSMKNIKRSYVHRAASTSSSNKEIFHYEITEIPTTTRNFFPNLSQTYSPHQLKENIGSNNNSIRQYPKRKIIPTKQQFEQTHYPLKYNLHNLNDSTLNTSFNHPKVSVKILLGNTTPNRSSGMNNIISARLSHHRVSNHKSSGSDILPQTYLSPMIENYRTSTTSKFIDPLPTITPGKSNHLFHSTQRNVSPRLPIRRDSLGNVSNSSNLLQYRNHGIEHISKRMSPLQIFRSEHQPSTQSHLQLVQDQTSKHKQLVHLKYSRGENTNCNYLIPK